MDDPDHPMGDAEDSSRLPLVPTTLGGNSLQSVLRSAEQRGAISTTMSSEHRSLTASGPTVFPKNPTTAEETPQRGAEGEVSLDSIAANLPLVAKSREAPTQSYVAENMAKVRGRQKLSAAGISAKEEMKRADGVALESQQFKRTQLASQGHTATQKASAPAPRDPFSFPIIKPYRPTPCFIALDADGPIVGHFKDTTGYKVTVEVDGGRWGNPCLTIKFTCNSGADQMETEVSADSDKTQSIHFRFRPGVKSTLLEGKFSIEDFEDMSLCGVALTGPSLWRSQVVRSVNWTEMPSVRVFRFVCNDIDIDALDQAAVKVWKQYKGTKVFELLKALMGIVPNSVTIWTLVDHSNEGNQQNVAALQRACQLQHRTSGNAQPEPSKEQNMIHKYDDYIVQLEKRNDNASQVEVIKAAKRVKAWKLYPDLLVLASPRPSPISFGPSSQSINRCCFRQPQRHLGRDSQQVHKTTSR